MPPPLSDNAVTFADGTSATVPQMAHDVVTFLTWAAEPNLEARHRTGFKVILFLVIAVGRLLRGEAQDLVGRPLSSPMTGPVIGIIGGSGLYEIDGLTDVEWRRVESPFGPTSDEFCFGTLDGQPVVFVPRHGRGHVLPPSEINFRANIDALKRCGVTDIVSLSAVGSLREDLAPGDFVVVDQFIDRTFAREKSFFGTGCVAHVSMAHPVCGRIGDALGRGGPPAGIALKRGGTYIVMEGPQFSTLAESELYRVLGLRRDRHDQHARGEARPRGRDLLRDGGDGHRLRLLASRPRRGHGRHDRRGAARQCRKGEGAGQAVVPSAVGA